MNYIARDKYQLRHLRQQRPVNKTTQKKVTNKYAFAALEVHEEKASFDKLSLVIRIYICANGLCNLQHNRLYRRISNYNNNNWNKRKNLTNDIDETIIKRANKIINIWRLKSAPNRNKIEPINVTNTLRQSYTHRPFWP